MCGIVGYAGPRPLGEVILPGLQRLEYRGYDSSGLAAIETAGIEVTRRVGPIAELLAAMDGHRFEGTVGVGHTRWATHGAPTETNAHPHRDCGGGVVVVHNGILENWVDLKNELVAEGHTFRSETDTEVLAHLIERHSDVSLAEAVRRVMRQADGALAIVALRNSEPDRIVAARRSSPLVVGLGDGENYLASDIPAFLEFTREVAVIDDDRVVEITSDNVEVTDLNGNTMPFETRTVTWDLESAERAGYPDFMLKEIHEQPKAIHDTLAGRITEANGIDLSELNLSVEQIRAFDKVFVVACGTSYHSAMMAKYAIERWTRIPVEIDIASEFRYRDPVLDENTLLIGISQSGETADTLAATRYGKAQGATVLSVANVVDSSMAREADAVLYTRAGPEIGVAATKTFVTQLVAMQLLALYLAKHRGSMDGGTLGLMVSALRDTQSQVAELLENAAEITKLAERYGDGRDFFFLGRGASYPVAMEGALKLKEIAYVRAEGYAAGEMKHGPIALIEDGTVIVGVATASHVAPKTHSNLQEMKARKGTVVAVLSEGDEEGAVVADDVMYVPHAPELVSPVLAVVPLQLFAYGIAKRKGLDVDKPRNLAKTVTVE